MLIVCAIDREYNQKKPAYSVRRFFLWLRVYWVFKRSVNVTGTA